MSARAGWKSVADSLFTGAGDVARNVAVTLTTQGTVFDSSIGGYTSSSSSVATLGIWQSSASRRFFKPEQVVTSKGIIMLRGSDFTTLLVPGDVLVVDTVDTYKVGAAVWDEAETGAYILVSVEQ